MDFEEIDIRWWVSLVFLAASLIPAGATAQVDVPPTPKGDHYIYDRARVLSGDAKQKIGGLQRTAAMSHQTQIVVVTIPNKSRYGGGGMSIQEFAEEWFNEWGIGIRRDGRLYDRGILVLVSVGDQRARIELGREWGHAWDEYCQRVMNETMIPQFKAGDYGLGIVRAVDALGQMAAEGPEGSPPEQAVADRWMGNAKNWIRQASFFSFNEAMGISAIGLILIIISLFIEDEKKSRWCFWIGVGIIVLALVTYILVAVIAMFADSEDNEAIGGFSGGGGFGGGMSGGGGASGGW